MLLQRYILHKNCNTFCNWVICSVQPQAAPFPSLPAPCRPVPDSLGNTNLLLQPPYPNQFLFSAPCPGSSCCSATADFTGAASDLKELKTQYHSGSTRYVNPKGPCYCLFPAGENKTAQFCYHKYNCQYQCELTKTEAIICDIKIGSGILEV